MRALLSSLLLLSAPALGQQAQAPGNASPSAAPTPAHPFAGLGRSPEEEARLEDFAGALRTYEEESREYRREVQLLLEKKYQEKRNTLANSYEKQIRDLEVRERRERLDAIAQFEEFLERYPDDPKYTPDVMFRLAELYYERSSDDLQLAMRDFEERMRALGDGAETPPEPRVDYSASIALYRRLLTEFPSYRYNDGALYLLGYCLEKQNQMEESLAQYETLIARYPRSRFTTEAWVRTGEYYFDADPTQVPDALTRAVKAYEMATQDTQHPLYDKALYKLGWTYYRVDRFSEAVGRFMALADFYEAQARARGEEVVGGDLREEALQYIAVSLVDEKFAGTPQADAAYRSLAGKPYESDIYRRLGNVYFDQTRHEEAIAAYRKVLQLEPLRPDAPEMQERIIQAYERDRRLQESFAEAERLEQMFAPGTPWYEANKRDPDVLAAAEVRAEKALYGSALYHHQQALVYKEEAKKDPSKAEQALRAFEVAARGYATYLERFPRGKSAYEMRYYRAECLYNSLQFAEAARVYESVRDDSASTKYRTESAISAVFSWQRMLDAEVRAGRLPDLKPLKSSERPEGQRPAAIALGELEQRLVAASDRFVELHPKDERSAGVAYKAAELYYSHNDFPEARRRFEALIQAYPQTEVSRFATNLIVESFLIDQDWASVEEVSGRLAANKDVIAPDSDLHKELVKFQLAGRFKLADQLMGEGKYEQAAAKYIQLVADEPRHEFADKALNNAAVCHEKVRKFDSALKLYERIFREYPTSTLADAALFRVAVNAEQSYDFEKAVVNYQRLVKDYPASKDREAALFNAARLLEGQQRYAEAARGFLRYAELFPNSEDAPKNQYRAALIYEKQEDWKGEIRALEDFVKKFSGRAAQVELVVDARKRIGEAWQKLGKDREAQKAFADAAAEFDRRNLKPESHPLAATAAAISRFQLAEYELQAFDKLKISGRGKALVRSLTAKKAAIKKASDAYTQVFKYKQLEWTLAAQYRRGYVLQRYATTLLESPVPPEVKRFGEEEVIAYQEAIANEALPFEDLAVQAYAATLQVARQNRVSNEWTRRVLEALNRLRPKDYPVLKEPKEYIAQEELYPEGLVVSVGAERQESSPARLSDGGDE